MESSPPWLSRSLVRLLFWVLTSVVGLVQAWSLRFTITPDGNSYLDIATAYLRGDYAHAINAYWSPLFSWLIAGCLRLLNPPGYRETVLLHLLNFAGLLIALRSFEYFFGGFLDFLEQSRDPQHETAINGSLWWLLGYELFFSTSLFVLSLEPTNPDIWLCVFTYLAMGILMRIGVKPRNLAYFVAFGFVLGLAYLTKSFYFPLSFVFFISGVFARGFSAKNLVRVSLAILIFGIVGGPFIFGISRQKHRFTFGDVGKIGYAECVTPILQPQFWQGDAQTGVPTHPARQILSDPNVFEFATPIGGSHPLSYDMSYWMDGVRPHFNFRGQLRIVRQSIGTFFSIFVIQLEFAVGLLTLWFFQRKRAESLYSLAHFWPLWLPPGLACAAYSLVLVEPRYVAPFLVFLWLAGFASVARASDASSKRILFAVLLGVLSVTGIKTAKYFVSDMAAMGHQQNEYWEVAQNLHKLGVEPGDRVSIIAGKAVAHWARLAGVKIVAELPLGEDATFWSGDRATQERVFAAFAGTGSRVVVAKDPPPDIALKDWHRLGDTDYYAHFLPVFP